jgi:RimJ/RimL family protein N-acetyltransferase
MPAADCVGALIRDGRHRVFVQRRSATRRLFPCIWDIVGGHVESGESPEQALAREIEEETGWRLRRIEALVADWEWEVGGVVRREWDYLVEVDGDLDAPRLEEGKQDAWAWVGPDNLDLMMERRTDGDRRLRDIVAAATRLRLTERLRLEAIGLQHVDDLRTLHNDPTVAHWYAGPWDVAHARRMAAEFAHGWEDAGVSKWIAYDRVRGHLVGRGGLSRLPADAEITRRIAATLGGDAWRRHRLELGWAVRDHLVGRGYATEIGRAGLAHAFDDLGAEQVVAFTERDNHRSRAVMERLGMRYVGEILGRGRVEGREGVHDGAPFALYVTDRSTTASLPHA